MTNGSISDFWKMKIGQKKARRPRTADFSPGFRLPIVPTDSNDPYQSCLYTLLYVLNMFIACNYCIFSFTSIRQKTLWNIVMKPLDSCRPNILQMHLSWPKHIFGNDSTKLKPIRTVIVDIMETVATMLIDNCIVLFELMKSREGTFVRMKYKGITCITACYKVYKEMGTIPIQKIMSYSKIQFKCTVLSITNSSLYIIVHVQYSDMSTHVFKIV